MERTIFWIKAALVSGLILSICMAFQPRIYPEVTTDVKPVKEITEEAKVALEKVVDAKDQEKALNEAIDLLPVEGKSLEEKVARWVSYDLGKIDSMKFKLASGVGISAKDAANKVHNGYARKKVIVEIFSNGKRTEYFLLCANGLVSKRWPGLVSESEIGRTRIIEHENSTSVGSMSGVGPNTLRLIPFGGSICGTLGVSPNEALSFCKKHNIPYWYKGRKLYALVHPGDSFRQINGKWEPVE